MKKNNNLLNKWLKEMEINDINFAEMPEDKTKFGENAITISESTVISKPKDEYSLTRLETKTNFNNFVLDEVPKPNIIAKANVTKQSPIDLARSIADSCNTLDDLKNSILNFDECSLKLAAKNTVFSDGNPKAKIMLIGEAPGATEDEQGIPFCGESGKLLDNMLSSIGLLRSENFYITNTIFWRPPANRPPTQTEIDICKPFLEKHIALVNPVLLILVGSTAVTSLLGNHLQISKIRREYYQYSNKYLKEEITTSALFHPAYLLRQPLQKKSSWYDLLKLKEFVNLKIPGYLKN